MSVKNIALLVIVIGLVMIIMQTNEPFEVINMADAGSVGLGGVCMHNRGIETGSTECAQNLYCINETTNTPVNVVLPSGKCKQCNGFDMVGRCNSS